jgi:hypothetical protein
MDSFRPANCYKKPASSLAIHGTTRKQRIGGIAMFQQLQLAG